MPARVVCTGLGVVTSIGLGKEAFWEGIVNTRCGAKPLIRLNEPQFSKKFAYEIAADFPEEAKIGRASAMALQTAEEAIDDAGLDGCEGAALVIGTGLCDIQGIEIGMAAGGFFIIENPTLDVGFKKAFSGEDDIKTPFDIIRCGLLTAPKKSKGGHSNERHTQFITHKMEL